MAVPLLILLSTHVLLPVAFFVWLWWPRPADRMTWAMRACYGAAYIAFIIVVGTWNWLSSTLTIILPVAYLFAVCLSGWKARRMAWRGEKQSLLHAHGFTAAMTVLFLAMTARGLAGYGYNEPPVDFDFPLASGTYWVAHGGNSQMLNYHNGNKSQRYALDIVALNNFGARADGLVPTSLEAYEIFGRTVVSPCTGVAISVHDDLPDNRISETNTAEPAGNHVVLACGTVRVLLAHFAKGSIAVDGGAIVTRGEPLGRVGNSGNSTEPHLHIHAYQGGTIDPDDGEGVPITFNGRFLVRGSKVTVEEPLSPAPTS
jgi:hypothetical protein